MKIEDIVDIQRNNNRPSVTGKALRNFKLSNKKISCVKGYMKKADGTNRTNVYYVSPYLMTLINYYAYKLHETKKTDFNLINLIKSIFSSKAAREIASQKDIYYSGFYINDDFFYETSYETFQKVLFEEMGNYERYAKFDFQNFYGSINIKKLESRNDKNLNEIINLLKKVGLNEFPIFPDSSGLSYVATVVYLEEADTKMLKYCSQRFIKFRFIRYSDDFYIFYNGGEQGEEFLNKVSEIYGNYNLKLNLDKYNDDITANLPAVVEGKLYDYFINDKDFNIHEVMGENEDIIENIQSFLMELKNVNTYDEYKTILDSHFNFYIGTESKFSKNLFNEILYNSKIRRLTKSIELKIDDKILMKILKLDPSRLTILFLNINNGIFSKSILHNIYLYLEDGKICHENMLICLTYYIQKDMYKETREKMISKISIHNKELAEYLEEFL